jgi:hypothetical protein
VNQRTDICADGNGSEATHLDVDLSGGNVSLVVTSVPPPDVRGSGTGARNGRDLMPIFPGAKLKRIYNNVGGRLPMKSPSELKGLALHITGPRSKDDPQTPPTLENIFNEFSAPTANKSAHFCVSRKGDIWQFADTATKCWAIDGFTVDAEWLSVENIAIVGEELTPEQLQTVAHLFGWIRSFTNIPKKLANRPGDSGLGSHSMFSPTDRKQDPGQKILDQRQKILDDSDRWALLGRWEVQIPPPKPETPTYIWHYVFLRNGEVLCTDVIDRFRVQFRGSWKIGNDGLKVGWEGKKSVERWTFPRQNPARTNQKGVCESPERYSLFARHLEPEEQNLRDRFKS